MNLISHQLRQVCFLKFIGLVSTENYRFIEILMFLIRYITLISLQEVDCSVILVDILMKIAQWIILGEQYIAKRITQKTQIMEIPVTLDIQVNYSFSTSIHFNELFIMVELNWGF